MTAQIRVAPELALPLDAVTETFAILAKRGAGKSNAAVVMAEEMHDAGLPWVAVDPKGDWWGIRSSRDGKADGLPVLVLGGRHGDVPLEPTAGALVADLLVEQRTCCIVDVSLMSKSDMRRFLADFAERLYIANTDPLHVFAEEAHEYIPQRVDAGAARMVGAWEKLVKWGRTHGLGVTLITQRSASLNKDVLTQVETLIALRTSGPQDQAQIRAWVDEHDTGAAMMAQLRKLANGEAFVLSPQWLELDEPLRIRFNQRRTFDSGATPRAGEQRVTPRSFAEVDLAALKEAMAETIERAQADDPKRLHARIRELEKQLAAEQATAPAEPQVKYVEIPVLDPAIAAELHSALSPLFDQLAHISGALSALREPSSPYRPGSDQNPHKAGNQGRPTTRSSAPRATSPSSVPGSAPGAGPAALREKNPPAARETRPAAAGGPGDVHLGKTERSILSVLAQHGPRTHDQLALLTGYSRKASTIGVALGKLRKAGLVEPGQPITATAAGIDWLGDAYEPLPEGEALVDYWRSKFGLTEQRVLDAVLAAYPHETNQAEIADVTGYSPTASTIGVALGRLRKVGVIDRWRISDDFAAMAGLDGA